MINLIGCLTTLALILLLSKTDLIGIKEAKIITILGWFITLYFAKIGF
jgi:hypothetical protein